jgi:predicted ester cyclase
LHGSGQWQAEAVTDSPADQELADRYRRYNALCNAHDFDRLGEFVADDIRVNDEPTGLAAYAAGLGEVAAAFPDYSWQIRHLVVDAPLVAAHFTDTGTHTGAPFLGVPATGRSVRVDEFSVYAWRDGLIAEVWVASDRLAALAQLE